VPYGASFETLCARLSPPGPEAWAACIALGASHDPRAIQVLARLAKSEDWRYRRVAIESLRLHPDARSLGDGIVDALSDCSAYVVRTACETVRALGLQEAHSRVVELCGVADSVTRQVAVEALGGLWQPWDFDAVLEIHLHDPEKKVRMAAAWTLAETVSTDTWRVLFSQWVSDPLPRHRVWACKLVQEFGRRVDVESLETLVHDGDGHVRKAAAHVIRMKTKTR